MTNISRQDEELRSEHKLYYLWPLLSAFGMVGTVLNSYVLFVFYSGRHSLVTSVNAMIGYIKGLKMNSFWVSSSFDSYFNKLFASIKWIKKN